jgi:hypothetical protein
MASDYALGIFKLFFRMLQETLPKLLTIQSDLLFRVAGGGHLTDPSVRVLADSTYPVT